MHTKLVPEGCHFPTSISENPKTEILTRVMQKQTNYTPGATLSRGMRYAIVKAVSPMISDFQLVIFRLSKTSRHGPAKKKENEKKRVSCGLN